MGPIYVLILAPRAVPIDSWFSQQEVVAGCSLHSSKTCCGVGAVAIDEGRRKRSWGHLSSDAVQSVSCSGKLPHPGDVVSQSSIFVEYGSTAYNALVVPVWVTG